MHNLPFSREHKHCVFLRVLVGCGLRMAKNVLPVACCVRKCGSPVSSHSLARYAKPCKTSSSPSSALTTTNAPYNDPAANIWCPMGHHTKHSSESEHASARRKCEALTEHVHTEHVLETLHGLHVYCEDLCTSCSNCTSCEKEE